ncbi:MAG: DUF5060 domain-containing protein [Chitinivibrionales bacterium]|nr:DUF5060 domain-containing protein [Chitinivibrionales bacterium]
MGTHIPEVTQWDTFELALEGPGTGNPFTDIELFGEFRQGNRHLRVRGFYDGDGIYRIRFMPPATGQWGYRIISTAPRLDRQEGLFECVNPGDGNHGPVAADNHSSLRYHDGTPFFALGTTSYGWVHQDPALVTQTLGTLDTAPFTKMRMCALPKRYEYVDQEPPLYPFEPGQGDAQWDFSRFNPAYFRNLEQRIMQLRDRGIQADLILFHPYDCGHWGFDRMGAETDDRFVRYLIARVGACRNVWWSMANEPQYVKSKTAKDWDRLFALVRAEDPYGHLCSIHGGYDFGADVITHVCGTRSPAESIEQFRAFGKPVVYDEHGYEGDVPYGWGNVNPRELVHQSWLAAASGAYPCAHSECFWNPELVLWWSRGGEVRGESVPRLAFLRDIMEQAPLGRLQPFDDAIPGNSQARVRDEHTGYLLAYTGSAQPRFYRAKLPESGHYAAEVIDTWAMTVEKVADDLSGTVDIALPARPYVLVRVTEAN